MSRAMKVIDGATVEGVNVSYMPIDVGFDPRRLKMQLVLPSGDRMTVRYEGKDGGAYEIRGYRKEVRKALEEAGYLVAE